MEAEHQKQLMREALRASVPAPVVRELLRDAVRNSFDAGLQAQALQHAEGRCDDC